jgi:uncharacterized protein with von Willebrand factor type A (vWA) domain
MANAPNPQLAEILEHLGRIDQRFDRIELELKTVREQQVTDVLLRAERANAEREEARVKILQDWVESKLISYFFGWASYHKGENALQHNSWRIKVE